MYDIFYVKHFQMNYSKAHDEFVINHLVGNSLRFLSSLYFMGVLSFERIYAKCQ